jgi:prolyl oligopeptidase
MPDRDERTLSRPAAAGRYGAAMPYPPARRLPLVEDLGGHRVSDPYRWLEDPQDPETQAWSVAQDRCWQDWAARRPWRAALAERILALEPGVRSAPVVVGTRMFWTAREPGQDHAVIWVDDADGARVLVDPNALGPDGTVTLDGWSPSLEGDRLAYLVSSGGDEESRLWVLDVATGESLDGPVDRVRYSPLAWLPGGGELLYVRRLPPERVPPGEEDFHRRLWRHRVGADADATDELLFGGDGRGPALHPTAYLGVEVSPDGRWAAVTVALGTAPRNELWVAELPTAGSPPSWQPALLDADARAEPHFDRTGQLWILTDLDAPRGRLVRTDPAAPAPARWVEILPEDPDGAVLEGWVLAGDRLVALRSRHALSELAVHERAGGAPIVGVALPGPCAATVSGRRDEEPEVWVGTTSYAMPYTVAPLDLRTGRLGEPLPVPGGSVADAPARSAGVEVRSLVCTSEDGTEIRVTITAPLGAEAGAPRPTVLYGYGGFGVSLAPAYSTTIAAWVAAGGVWAVANLRGGGEEGEAWHRDGMRERKHHVFEDFEAAADRLVADGWCSPETLGIFGGSNGGLLVGAALTRRPDRYRAVVCSAPLLDMVRYERFGLGRTWNDEYGTAEDPRELAWLLSYSPYHHVRDGVCYPAVLFTTFDSDSRVDPLHARKMAAALQAATSGDEADRPILLRRERDVGHGARSARRAAALAADELAFLGVHTGLDLAR